MANSKLLKEAIADAKAVKETALANAKLALEEAFTPRLQSILSKKMKAEAEQNDDDEDDNKNPFANEELSSSDIGPGPKKDSDSPKNPKGFDADTDLSVGVKKAGGNPGSTDSNMKKVKDISEQDEIDLDSAPEDTFDGAQNGDDDGMDMKAEIARLSARISELEGGGDEDPFGAQDDTIEKDDNDPSADGFPDMAGAPEDGGEQGQGFGDFDAQAGAPEDGGEGNDEDGLDLEAIIRELEAQLGQSGEEEDPMANPMADDEAPVAETLANGSEAGTDKGEDPRVVKSTGDGSPIKESDDKDADDKGGDDDVVDLDEILREMEADMKKDKDDEKDESVSVYKKDLAEAYKTIKSLQSTLNEINLLNAKLLFANKLFRAHNMTNEQKVKIIESLDRTKSVREVKLVYSTLAESFKYPTQTQNKAVKKSIAEGLASKVVKSTKPNGPTAAQKQIITESTAQANRFKKLAGILK